MRQNQSLRRKLALLLVLSLIFSASGLSACGGQKPRATTMHLAQAEGSVGVAGDDGASIEPAEQLGLYDGYQVATRSESYAWIDLDRVKLTEMDAESRIEIQKDGKDLEIPVQSGGTEPRENPDEASGEQDGPPGQEALPADIAASQFVFASGAGAWATVLTLHPDGSFEGEYYDSNQGESGNGYEATLYTCVFRGQMENIQKTDDNTWSMTVSGISTEVTPGQEWIEDKVRHVATTPNGLTEGDSVCLYAPETLLGELPEESLIWKITDREDLSRPLGAYAFYNMTQETAFFQ